MSTSPNIRPACGRRTGEVTRKFVGGCFQNVNSRIDNIKVKRNITLMKDYASGSGYDPNGIEPYAFAEQTTAPDCSPYNDGGCPGNPCYVCGETGGGGNGYLPCGHPLTSDIIQYTSGSGTGSFDVGPYKNWYVQTNETQSYSNCRDIGYKNAYAHKSWHGRFSYDSRTLGLPDSWDWCCQCGIHLEDTTPDGTHYLSMAAEASTLSHTDYYNHNTLDPVTCYCGETPINSDCYESVFDHDVEVTQAASSTCTVDRYSGNTTGNCTGDDIDNERAYELLSMANGDAGDLIDLWCPAILTTPDVVTQLGPASWHLEWHTTYDCYDHCGNLTSSTTEITVEMTITPTSLEIIHYGTDPYYCSRNGCPQCDDCCAPWIETGRWTYTFGSTTFTYVHDSLIFSESLQGTYHEDCDGSLSNPYTSEQLHEDVVHLLSYLPLDRDDLLPWRQDGNVTQGPVCYYDESPASPSIPWCSSSNTTSSTGEIYGIPAPTGTDRVWNPNHANYCICDSLVKPGNRIVYIKSWGAWNTEIGGGSPTAWLNDYEATSVPQGAFEGHGFRWTTPGTDSDTPPIRIIVDELWAGKYAEIIFPQKKSINFARPCGKDRFMPSASTETCISSFTGDVLTLEPSGPPTPVQSGDYVWVCGTTDLDGCWIATRDSDYQITLQEPRIVSASALPSQPVSDCGTGIVMPLRWKNLQPAICGKLSITAATKAAPAVITLEDDTYLVDGDKILIEGAIGGGINGLWTVSVITPSIISLNGSDNTAASPYTGSGRAYSPYTPDWKWNDESPKGEFQIIKWDYNYRDIGEYLRISQSVPFVTNEFKCDPPASPATPCDPPTIPPEPRPNSPYAQEITSVTCETQCLPYNACAPNVAFFSPNSESFKSSQSFYVGSRNYGWDYNLYDSQYGAMWQAMVRQAIDDPFWQAPPCPCSYDGDLMTYGCNVLMTEDNGSCQADTEGIVYYAKAPQVEARCELPAGAPALPRGKYLGCRKVTDTSTPGNICDPPYSDSDAMYNNPDGCSTYYVYPWATPWVTYLAELNCVCTDGRFRQEYVDAGVLCDQPTYLPPP